MQESPSNQVTAVLLHLVKKGSLTTCLTTDSAGALGNSGIKSDKEWAECSEKGQKLLEITRKNLVQPFGIFVQEKRTHSEKIIESPLKT